MRRRYIALFVAAAILMVPGLTLALPRPTESQTAQETEITSGGPIQIFANNPAGVETPIALVTDRSYRFAVSGLWKPTSGSANFADARCETFDGGTTWSHTGKGLRIGSTFYGASGVCRTDHSYSFTVIGRGIEENMRIIDPQTYSDNIGYLEVRIFQQSIVTWEYPIVDLVLPGGEVVVPIPTTTVTPGTVPPITVPPVTIPGIGVPVLGALTFYHQGQFWCANLSVGNQSQPVGCVFDPAGLPDTSITIGGNSVAPGTTICDPSSPEPFCTLVPGIPLQPIVIPGTSVGVVIPEGSTMKLSLSWTADTTKLWKTQVNDKDPSTGEESTAVWAPFHTSGRDWFIGEVQQGRLALKIKVSVKDPQGNDVVTFPEISVAGLGQILEAMFVTKVLGN